MATLTKKQRIFVKEYLVDSNATRAARAAGYSKSSADQIGSRLLKHVKVAAELDRLTTKRCEKLEITADRVLAELARLAFVDPRKFFNADGTAKDIAELDDDTAPSLAGIEVDEIWKGRGEDRKKVGETKKFKIADKGINLERLGKHLKLFTDKVEHTADGESPIRVLWIGERKNVEQRQ
jgi:phage terminase small subunit